MSEEKKKEEQGLLAQIEDIKKSIASIPADLKAGLGKTVDAQEKKIAELEAQLKAVQSGEVEKTKMLADKEKVWEDRSQKIEDLEKAVNRKFSFDPADAFGKKEEQKFSLAKFFRGMRMKDWKGAEFELDVVTKAMGGNSATAGGYLVPEQYIAELKERVTAQAVIRKLNPTIYPMSSESVLIPTLEGGATGYWIGQNTQITGSDAKTGQAKLVANTLAALVKMSNQLINDSNPKADEAVRRDTAKVLALAEDLAFINGDGADKPLGIINYPVGTDKYKQIREFTNGANGDSYAGVAAYDKIYDQLYEIENNNGVATGWVMHPRTKNSLRKVKDSQNNYIYNVSPLLKEGDTLVGLPVVLSTQVPITLTVGSSSDCSFIICGQWDECVIGEREGMEFSLDQSGTAFEYYQTWIRGIKRVGMILRTPGVFCKATGVRP